MKYLITGGAGFIGSYLAEYLLKRNHEVNVFDDLSTGRWSNISHLQDFASFKFIHGDILDEDKLGKAISEVDQVFHLAAAVGVKYIYDNPVKSIIINIRGTENVLNHCLEFLKKVFLASSSEVYGRDVRNNESLRESDKISLNPSLRLSYGATKAANEILAAAIHKEKGFPLVIGRYFNTIGPRQIDTYGMVVPRFINQALKNEPITVYGDGSQVRSFINVLDVVRASVKLMNNPKAEGEIFNIGSPTPITIKKLAHKIKKIVSSQSEIVYIPYKQVYGTDFQDINYRVPNIEKLRKYIKFDPDRDLEKILKKIVDFKRKMIRSS